MFKRIDESIKLIDLYCFLLLIIFMDSTTIVINKETARKVRKLAEEEKRSVSAQIDYLLQKYFEKVEKEA